MCTKGNVNSLQNSPEKNFIPEKDNTPREFEARKNIIHETSAMPIEIIGTSNDILIHSPLLWWLFIYSILVSLNK